MPDPLAVGGPGRSTGKAPWQTALVVALIATGALALRLFLSWPSVFGEDYVAFIENDAWYHMRLVDALVRDFPWRIWHDPYLLHPGGEAVNAGPVLDWIIAATALLLGAGAPSPRLVDVVGASVPPVLGALTVVPVYVLGSRLFSRHAGLWAAVMIAVMPGQLLRRSLLGFTDHHCAEVLLSTTAMMFVVLALDGRQTTVRRRAYTLAAGGALGAYLLTWGGGVVFVAIIALWAALQLLVDAGRGAESDDVAGVAVPMLLIAAVMVLPWAGTRPQFTYQLASLAGAAVAIGAWPLGRQVWRRRTWGGRRWLFAAAAAGCVAAAIAWIAMSDSAASLVEDARRVSPFRQAGSVFEAQPLMASSIWRPVPLWKEFTSSLVLAICGTGLLLGSAVIGRRSPPMALLAWWTAVMIVATFGQVRFAYYLAVNVALLGGYTCDRLVGAVGAIRGDRATRALAAVVVFSLIALPGVPMLRPIRNVGALLDSNWHDALTWLATNTPEPFGNPAEYYRTGGGPSAVADYGVLAWWDYGYWITRVARRVPVANPRQSGMREAALFLVSSNEADANRVAERLGARYIAVDWQLQWTNTLSASAQRGFFQAIALAAGRNLSDYCGLFSEASVSAGMSETPVVYCYPEYYRTMAMRLYLYGGRAATPAAPVVVVSHRREMRGTRAVNVVTQEWRFATYDEASRFVTSSGRPDVTIVSKHPHETCVPLEALSSYTTVFKAIERDGGDATAPPVVQLFEYRPHAPTGR